MDKPLAVEYTGKKKWYAYEVFEQLKFDQSERMHILKPQDSQELHSGDFRFDFDEENKQEDQKNSDEDDSASSSDNSEDEIIENYHQADLQSLKKEINDLKNDFHTWMEKISAPLNIIANSIVQNKPPVIEMPIIEENVQVQEENKETPQSKVVIYQVEDLNSIRDKYPYEIFIKDKLPNVDKQSQKKYSKALKLSKNIAPLAFFLFKNTELNASTMKSYAATCKEYYKEYKEFDLEMLKSLYIQKDFMKSESKETLKKKWKQWRRICHVSFGISKSNFPKIQFTSTAKTNKHVQLNLDKDDIENSWKTLAKNGKTEDALLVHIIYELGLRTGEV